VPADGGGAPATTGTGAAPTGRTAVPTGPPGREHGLHAVDQDAVASAGARPSRRPGDPADAETARARRRTRHAGWLALGALALLFTAWVIGNPPGGVSDEPSHLIKAAALSVGDVEGSPVAYSSIGNWPASKIDWTSRTARILHVPPGYSGCNGFTVPITGPCGPGSQQLDRPLPPGTSVSYVATYPPFAYVPAAIGVRIASALGKGPYAGLIAARAADALVALLFLAGTGRLLRRRDGGDLPVLAGASLAVTPLVVLTAAQVGDSALEISGALCFAAGLLRLAAPRPADLSPRAVWTWTCLGGLGLVGARPLGPVFLVLITALVLLLRGRRLLRAPRLAPWTAGIVGVALAAATLASLTWEFTVEPHPHVSLGTVLSNVPHGVAQLLGVADMWVGRLGWVAVRLPLFLVVVWLLLIVGLVAVAARVGTRRERWTMAVTVLLAVLTTVGVWAGVIGATSPEFVMQARYVVPVLSMVPLIAVDVLREHLAELERRWGARPMVAAAGVLVFVGLGHAVAFETGVTAFRGLWEPPLHWETSEVLVLLAVLLSIAAAVRSLRATDLPVRPDPAGAGPPPGQAARAPSGRRSSGRSPD
jgi:Predicted membrane protein (DUF2142)